MTKDIELRCSHCTMTTGKSFIYQHIARCYLNEHFTDIAMYWDGSRINLQFIETGQSYQLLPTSREDWTLFKGTGPIAGGRLDVLLVYLKGLEEMEDGRT